MGPGGLWWSNVLNSALPPQRLRPDTRPEHQDPVSHMAWNDSSHQPVRICLCEDLFPFLFFPLCALSGFTGSQGAVCAGPSPLAFPTRVPGSGSQPWMASGDSHFLAFMPLGLSHRVVLTGNSLAVQWLGLCALPVELDRYVSIY